MARDRSIFTNGFQGTLGGVTFVKSKKYGDHVRTKRGTYSKAKVNDAFKENNAQLKTAVTPAKLIFNALRDEHKDGDLWNRLLNVYRQKIKEELPPNLACLQGWECSLEYKLSDLINLTPIEVRIEDNKLNVTSRLYEAPFWRKYKSVEAYRIGIIVFFVDFKWNDLEKQTFYGPVTDLKVQPGPISISLPLPTFSKEYAVLMKIEGCLQGEPLNTSNVNGMKILATGVIEE